MSPTVEGLVAQASAALSHAAVSTRASRYRSLSDEESLRTLVANLRVGIYIAGASGEILDANPAFCEMLGVADLAELGPYGLDDLIIDATRRAEELELLQRDGAVRDFELPIALPDGRRRTMLDTTFVVRDDATGETFYHGILVDITQRKELEEQLRRETTRDPLTGCYNRRWLHQIESRLNGHPDPRWGCIFLDIDHFKQYNEQHGHRMGDTTLVRMARFLMRQVRADESVVRVGGDEFLIVLEHVTADGTEAVARRVQRAALRAAPVPFSLGWASRRGTESLRQTIHRADKNLMAVRVLGRKTQARGKPPKA